MILKRKSYFLPLISAMIALSITGCQRMNSELDENAQALIETPANAASSISRSSTSSLSTLADQPVQRRLESRTTRITTPTSAVLNARLSAPTRQLGAVSKSDAVDIHTRNVTLNLVNAPILQAAETILGEMFDKNIVIDPTLDGRITISNSKPISMATALETFELALAQNDARLIDRGDTLEIVRLSESNGALNIAASRSTRINPGYSIRILPLDFIAADEMAAILRPLAGDGLLAVDQARNLIVMAGDSNDQRAWAETVASFDVDWLSDRAVGIFPVIGRSARSIINSLERYVEMGDDNEPLAYFEIIPENNSILAVTRSHDILLSISNMIDRIVERTANDVELYAYEMRHADASKVAVTLADVFNAESSTTTTTGDNPANQASSPTNASSNASAGSAQNGFKIIANTETNTLLIRTSSQIWPQIVSVLEQIDIPTRQVLVEATILEVSLNDTLRYGVQYFLEFGGNDSNLILSASGSPIAPTLPGAALSLLDNPSVIIDALDDITEVNLISSPNMMVLNNQSARLVVGEQIPVATGQAEDVSENNEVFASTVEFRDTGIIFEVTPRINSAGSLEIDVRQEVSNVIASSGETLTPTITQRVLQSSVSVDSGETVLLGGLFSERTSAGRSGVPGLVDIPFIGNLFGRTSKIGNQTELVVLITPKIINDRVDMQEITAKVYDRIKRFDSSRSITKKFKAKPGMSGGFSNILAGHSSDMSVERLDRPEINSGCALPISAPPDNNLPRSISIGILDIC